MSIVNVKLKYNCLIINEIIFYYNFSIKSIYICTMTKQEIVKSIKDKRKELGITQEELATLVNTHKPDISNIEAGNTNITIDRLIIICNALKLTISVD